MEILLAFYIGAARECRKLDPEKAVTAASLHKFMMDRCQEQPLVLMMTMWIRYTDVVLMMQESGRGEPGSFGDHDLYLTASRLANNLRAVSNAFNYLHTTTHGSREYQCASDQIRLVIDKFVFVSRTRTGKPLFSDLAVEKAVGDVRYEFGKIATRTIVGGRLEAMSAYMPVRVQSRTEGGSSAISSSTQFKESSLTRKTSVYVLSNVAYETLLFQERHSIWSLGRPLLNDKGVVIPDGFFSLDCEPLNPQLLISESIGSARYLLYVEDHWLDPASVPATIELATTRFETIVPKWLMLQQRRSGDIFHLQRQIFHCYPRNSPEAGSRVRPQSS
jgi:hypothetical protein